MITHSFSHIHKQHRKNWHIEVEGTQYKKRIINKFKHGHFQQQHWCVDQWRKESLCVRRFYFVSFALARSLAHLFIGSLTCGALSIGLCLCDLLQNQIQPKSSIKKNYFFFLFIKDFYNFLKWLLWFDVAIAIRAFHILLLRIDHTCKLEAHLQSNMVFFL